MLNKLKVTAKHTLIYSIGNLSTKIIGLLLLPLYTAKLSLLNYGRFTILETTSMFLTMVLGLRIVSSMMRWSAETEDRNEHGKIFFNSYALLLVTAITVNIVFIPMKPWLSQIFFSSIEYTHFFTVIFLIIGLEMVNQVPMNLFRFQGKPIIYSSFFAVKLIIVLLLNIYFLVYAETGVIGIFYSQLIANIIQMLCTIPVLLKNFSYRFDLDLIKEMLGYSVPLIFSAISVQLLAIGDRYIIKYLLDYSQVGIYSIGYKLSGVINVFIIQAFALGFLPIAYKMQDSKDAQIFFKKVFKYFSMILVFGALGISLFSQEILLVFAQKPEYYAAYKIVPLITTAFIFKGIQYIFLLGFHYVKKTKYVAYIVTIALFINIALNFLLIPRFGIWGAALTTVISSIFISVVSYFASQKFYPVGYEIGKMFLVFAVGFVLYYMSGLLTGTNIYYGIGIKFVLLLAFPILLYIFKFYEYTELDKIKKVLRKYRR